ncbi:hypothetical protein BpHYR1_007047 [Brachionus plicatilis]|uniref:Uncharacterized protein n=1 Tax=Brachionus plicatilis TaxID=10195 RepID=A0A3M7S868_BRAPC|nr:hypothetical protein BpHYR1_007047 [Brachionus plicatilis]
MLKYIISNDHTTIYMPTIHNQIDAAKDQYLGLHRWTDFLRSPVNSSLSFKIGSKRDYPVILSADNIFCYQTGHLRFGNFFDNIFCYPHDNKTGGDQFDNKICYQLITLPLHVTPFIVICHYVSNTGVFSYQLKRNFYGNLEKPNQPLKFISKQNKDRSYQPSWCQSLSSELPKHVL